MRIRGRFHVELVDRYGRVKSWHCLPNAACNGGLNDVLSAAFAAGTQRTAWSIGLIDNASFTALADADTMASHAGWIESTAYTEANRPQWVMGAVSNQQLATSTDATFTMNAAASIKGLFLATNNTKGGTTGILYATAPFAAGALTPASGEILRASYTLTLDQG